MEPILHVLVPFLTLSALGIRKKDAVYLSLLGALPDLDALWRAHRVTLHSFLIMLVITASSLVLVRNFRPQHIRMAYLAMAVLFSHVFIDLFFGYVAVAWPLSNFAVGIISQIKVNAANPLHTVRMNFQVKIISFDEMPVVYESNLLTEFGIVVALVTIIGTLVKYRNVWLSYLKKKI